MAQNYRSPTYYELAAPPELDWRPYRPPEYLQYRRQWDRRGLTGEAGDFPLHLDVDPTNRCNLRCRMCPRTYYVERGLTNWAPGGLSEMDLGLYRKLIDESAEAGLKSVKLNFLGEPLMFPAISEMVALAAARGLWVMINTNAVLLTARMSRELLKAGLTDIFFSFDSPYPEAYEAVRVGATYSQVLANVQTFMDIKDELGLKAVQTRASMVLPEGNDDELKQVKADYIRLFRDLKVAEIGFGLPSVLDCDYRKLSAPSNFKCPDLFRRMFVFNDGVCGPCCGDWERKLVVGEAGTTSLADIWRGAEYQRLRRYHLEGRYREIEACAACSVPYLSAQGV